MANTAHPFHVLPYVQCTLIICYRIRSVRLFFVTVCAVYAYFLLPYAQGTLIICYRMRRVRLLFVTACAAYAYKA
jgi:hypothetical protein